MKRILFLLTALVFFYSAANSQTAEDSVKAAVNQLFNGMKNADAAMIRSSFADSAILQTIARDKEGKTVIQNESVADFANFISTVKKGAADEQIVFETIKIDGPLAMAWTPYKFYFDGNFSHCGVDCFQLVRINGAWKIQYLIDTRRKQPCN
jgi:hypothetical protein